MLIGITVAQLSGEAYRVSEKLDYVSQNRTLEAWKCMRRRQRVAVVNSAYAGSAQRIYALEKGDGLDRLTNRGLRNSDYGFSLSTIRNLKSAFRNSHEGLRAQLARAG